MDWVGAGLRVRGDLVYAADDGSLRSHPDGILQLDGAGRIRAVEASPGEPSGPGELLDCSGCLVIPPFVDLHLHAPQYPNIGLGTGMELLPWLRTYTFPEEARYGDPEYAGRVYRRLIRRLWEVGSLRSVQYATIHRETAGLLVRLLEESGLQARVGKVSMDRHAPEGTRETTGDAIRDAAGFLEETAGGSGRVRAVVTPRFVPSCSGDLLAALGRLAREHDVAVQSHLSENPEEVEWVRSLFPESPHYAGVYDRFGLFGDQPTLMAHCIYCTPAERALLKERGVVAVHCPVSNVNLASGIMPVRTFLREKIPVGLGSDISGGHEIRMFRVMVMAIAQSRMWARMAGDMTLALGPGEVFFLGTRGGGALFGRRGAFEPGYPGDFLVIRDAPDAGENPRSPEERLARFLYTGSETQIEHRYLDGQAVPCPFPELRTPAAR